MSWKNTLRKAPFDMGQAQDKRLNELKAKKEQLMNEFPKILEDFLDDEIREAINKDPNSGRYTVSATEVTEAVKNLKRNGVSHQEIEEYLKNAYKASRVKMSHPDAIIILEGVSKV
tara:strand:- start:109 stop:456 length:348 start_codon:yes stop_codon:yes gene_type:complete